MNPYYADESVTLYHGDCREVTAWLEADVLVTDPPYGIAFTTGMDHRKNTDRNRTRDVAGDLDTSARDYVLTMWAGGSSDRPAIVFGSWKAERPTGTRALLTWHKGLNCGMGDLSMPWKPNTEEVYILGSGYRGHRGSSVLDYQAPPSQVSWGRLHPTQKPLDLMAALISKCPPDAVADPFAGSGSTLVAAKQLGRKAIGVELEERYCEVIAKRLAQGVLDFGSAS
jgi:site-specific DNA-methyltransferase (adenine-specific)